MKMTIQNKFTQFMLATLIVAGVGFLSPFTTEAATTTTCTFTRDLKLGMTGDDIKCLQKYLNTHGYVIAASGVGSVGHETGEYKALTEAAVIKWQKTNKLVPSIGYFGAQSRLFIKKGSSVATAASGTTEPYLGAPLLQVPAVAVATTPEAALLAQVAALKAVLEGRTTTLPVATTTNATVAATVVTTVATPVTTTTTGDTDASVRILLSDVLAGVAKADSAIKKGTSGTGLSDAKDTIAAAKDEVLIALRAYVSNDYATAATTLTKAKKDATLAYTSATATSVKQKANKALTAVQNNYSDVNDKIIAADAKGKSVTSAKKYLKKAASAIGDTQTAIDDGKYDEALTDANGAGVYLNDAENAL